MQANLGHLPCYWVNRLRPKSYEEHLFRVHNDLFDQLSATNPHERLRVALLAGTLGQGGAEKQLVYMVRTLQRAGVDVRVYSLTRGEFYEKALMAMHLHSTWVGRFGNPLLRLADIIRSGVALKLKRRDPLLMTSKKEKGEKPDPQPHARAVKHCSRCDRSLPSASPALLETTPR